MNTLFITFTAFALQPPIAGLDLASNGGSPVSVAPLAAGEVLLEVSAIGTVLTPADAVTFNLTVPGQGANSAEALASRAANIERVRRAARASGSTERDIRINNNSVSPFLPTEMLARPSDARPGPNVTVSSNVRVRLRDVARADAFTRDLQAIGVDVNGGPTFSLADAGPARRAARAQALATARADAEAYASALAMRVVRIARVTERVGIDLFSLLAGAEDRFGGPGRRGSSSEVETVANVGVDFVLVPR